MKIQRERIVKTRAGWKKEDQVKRIKIVMTVVAVALCLSIAAGSVLAWVEIKKPFDTQSSSSKPVSSVPPSSESKELPVYDDTYNLVLVNSNNVLKSDFKVQLEDFNGVKVDGRIVPALEKMMKAAKADGCPLKLTGGYVDAGQQNKQFQAVVQDLMKKQSYSQVRAENQAQLSVGRANYNEYQTGMAVNFWAEGLAANGNFTATPQYKWLIKNSVQYGFVLRYADDTMEVTNRSFDPRHFRYVGTENAINMRQYSMCLEEYATYRRKTFAG